MLYVLWELSDLQATARSGNSFSSPTIQCLPSLSSPDTSQSSVGGAVTQLHIVTHTTQGSASAQHLKHLSNMGSNQQRLAFFSKSCQQ